MPSSLPFCGGVRDQGGTPTSHAGKPAILPSMAPSPSPVGANPYLGLLRNTGRGLDGWLLPRDEKILALRKLASQGKEI